jgi:hypothetical protein
VPVTVGVTTWRIFVHPQTHLHARRKPHPLVAAHVYVTPCVFSTTFTVPHPLLLAIPVSGSLRFQLSVTVLVYHPFAPATPLTDDAPPAGVWSPPSGDSPPPGNPDSNGSAPSRARPNSAEDLRTRFPFVALPQRLHPHPPPVRGAPVDLRVSPVCFS